MTKNRKQNGNLFSTRFCSSGKAAGPRGAQAYCSTSSTVDGPRTQPGCKIAAKKRRRIAIHRGRADWQGQCSNRKKEPPKCEDCEYSSPAVGAGVMIFTCDHKKPSHRLIVLATDSCEKFVTSRELIAPHLAAALAEGAKLIPLTKGKFAIVDAEDYESLNRYKWHAQKGGRTYYARTQEKGKTIRMHRMVVNAPKGLFVDHIDHNGLNNRKSNLRLCTNSQNNHNQRPYGKTSRYKGVCWDTGSNKFRAKITYNGKSIHLGRFVNEDDAAKAYDKKAKEFFGSFAYLNFPA